MNEDYISAYLEIQEKAQSSNSSSQEQSNGYILMSRFHKMFFDTKSSLRFLDSAFKYSNSKYLENLIQAELSMALFNLEEYEKSDSVTSQILSNKNLQINKRTEGILLLQTAAIENIKGNPRTSKNIVKKVEELFSKNYECDLTLAYLGYLRIMETTKDTSGLNSLVLKAENLRNSCKSIQYAILFKQNTRAIYKALGNKVLENELKAQSDSLKLLLHKNSPLPNLGEIKESANHIKLEEKFRSTQKRNIVLFSILGLALLSASIGLFLHFKKGRN